MRLFKEFVWQFTVKLRTSLSGVLVCVVLSAALSGCAALGATATAEPSPSPTPQPSETPTPTATIVWFPPTVTPTPLPTLPPASPTPDLRPNLGEVLLNDSFDDPSVWTLNTTSAAGAALGKNELTLVVKQQRAFAVSMRSEPVLGNFYAEITINPVFCRGQDEYGLLLRAASNDDYYRFALSCDSHVRLDRVVGGQASSPQPRLYNALVPSSGHSLVRLGIWLRGAEMRFFIDDQLLLRLRDPLLSSGLIGVFARSASAEEVTVNFSELVVYSLTP